MADLYYYDDGYFDPALGYFVYTADAQSNQTSTATITCDATKIAGGVAVFGSGSWNTGATLSCTLSNLYGADLFAFSDAALTAQVSRLRDNNISASSAFSVATDVSRTRNYSSDEAADFTITVANQRVRFNEAAIDAAFSLTADLTRQPGVIVTGTGSWTSTSSLSTTAVRTFNVSSSQSSAFTETAQANRLAGLISNQNSSVSLTANNSRTREVNAAATSAFTQVTSTNVTRQLQSALSSHATLSATISHIEGADLQAFSNATLSATSNITRTSSVVLQSTATQTTSAVKSAVAVSSLTSAFTVSANVTKLVQYWYTENSTMDAGYGIATDSAGNIITIGTYNSGNDLILIKKDRYGNTLWNRTFGTASSDYVPRIGIDSSNNIYLTALTTTTGEVAKYNSSGALQWQRNLTPATGSIQFNDIAVDSAGNSYVAGRASNTGSLIVKYNSSGVIQWQKTISAGAAFTRIVLDSTGAPYVVRSQSNSIILTKISTAGALTWERIISATSFGSPSLAIDSSNNLYVTGISGTSTFVNSIIKINSSGTKQWAYSFNAPYGLPFYSISWYANKLYIGTDTHVLYQVDDSTGAVDWCKQYSTGRSTQYGLYISDIEATANGIVVAGSNYISFSPSTQFGTISKWALNGSGTPADGTFSNYSYTTNTLSPTVISNTPTLSTSTNTDAAGIFTDSTTTATEYIFTPITGVGTIKTFNAALSSAATVSASGTRLVLQSAALASTATLIAQPSNNIKTTSANLQANGFVAVITANTLQEVASLSSAFTLTASVDKIKNAQAALTSTAILTASALDLDLAQANLNSNFTLSIVTTKKIVGSANLQVTATVEVKDDFTALRLYGDHTSPYTTAGYITSTGGPISHSISTGSSLGFHTIWANFWFRTELFSADDVVYIYIGGQNSLQESTPPYTYGNARPQIYLQRSSGVYYLKIRNTVTHTPGQNLGVVGGDGLFNITQTTYVSTINLGSSFDPTQWHNVHVPLVLGRAMTSTGGSNWPDYGLAIVPNSAIDGTTVTLSTSVSLDDAQPRGAYTTPYMTVDAEGGEWGHYGNRVDLFLSRVWIGSCGTGTDLSNATEFPVTEFYGSTSNISANGTTASGYAPQVWLPFNRSSQLLDKNNSSPTWNYTATNQVTIGITKDFYAGLNSAFTQVSRVTRIVQGDAALSSAFTTSINNRRVRYSTGALTSTATVVARGQRNAILNSALQSTATVVANLSRTERFTSALQSTATLTINSKKIVFVQSAQTSAFTQVTNQHVIRTTPAALTSQATVSAFAIKTVRATGAFQAFATELNIINKIGRGFIHMDSTATVHITGRVITDLPQFLHSTATLTANVINTKFGQSNQQVTASLTLNPTYLRHTEVHATATATVQANAKRTRAISSTMGANAYQQTATDNSKLTGYQANLTSNTELTANNQIVRLAQAHLEVTAEIPFALGGVMVRFEANLVCEGFVLTAGKVINIDPYYQIKIKPERRTLWIAEETRIISINSETRVNKIRGYPQ